MTADVPTMLAMIIASSLLMAACLVVAGARCPRDGLGYWAVGLLLSAVGHWLLVLRGQVPDVVSVVGGNVALAGVVVGMTAAIYQFQRRAVSWWWLLAPAALMAVVCAVFIDNYRTRVGITGAIVGLQTIWAVRVTLQGRRSAIGWGQWLLVAGLALESLVLGARALMLVFMDVEAVDVLQGGGLQTLIFMSTFGMVLVSSVGFVFMSRDRADEHNRMMAALDPLSGVANRRSLIAALERDVARALRTRQPIALMMVDIDHFKHVNDQHGHLAGDQALCNVANVLGKRVRAQDLVGRYGGEEFMVLLPDTELMGAEQLARELCRVVRESHCTFASGHGGPGARIAVTVSIGVFGGQLESGDRWDMLIAAADRALYQAKENGRNRVEVAPVLRRPERAVATVVA